MIALLVYYVFGVLWVATGLLPQPFGWLRHHMSVMVAVTYALVLGAIWPLILVKIVVAGFRGDDMVEL